MLLRWLLPLWSLVGLRSAEAFAPLRPGSLTGKVPCTIATTSNSFRGGVSNLRKGRSCCDVPAWTRLSSQPPEASGSLGDPNRGVNVKAVVLLILGELMVGALAIPLGHFFKIDPLANLVTGPVLPLLGQAVALTIPILVFHFLSGREIEDMLREGLKGVFGDKPGILTVLALSIALSMSAGIGEEVLFRGTVQPILAAKWGPMAGIGLSSLLFGALHASTPRYFLLATILSLYLGTLHHKLSCLLIPIVIHTLFDVLGFLKHTLAASVAVRLRLWRSRKEVTRAEGCGLR